MSKRHIADAIVIGAGFGGLGAALTLAEQGAKVVLLEALNYPGGCASTFSRDGYLFEAGATLFSGFGEGQLMARWIDEHRLDVELDWPTPLIELRTPNLNLAIASDRGELEATFAALPGAPVAELKRFFARQKRVADTLWTLLDDPSLLPPFHPDALRTHLLRTPRYATLLPLMGRPLESVLKWDGVADFAPLRVFLDALCQITVQASVAEAESTFALAATDYLFRGTAHVRGGIGKLAWALTRAVENQAGEVAMATRARRLESSDGGWRVVTKHTTYEAPIVVANLLPQALTKLAPDLKDDRWLAAQAKRVEGGWSAAMFYLGLDGRAIQRDEAHHLELIADDTAPYQEGNHVFCSVSGRDETERAPAGQRTATLSTHLPMASFLALPASQRGAEVERVQNEMWRTVERLAPELAEAARHKLPASPRTFERFTGRPLGFVGGVPRRAGFDHYLNLLPRPVARGLYLVGDSVFLGQSTLATAVGGSRTALTALAAFRD